MISINNLHARVEEKDILKGLSLDIKPGEVHAIMGPNGAGKSTLGNVLAGREGYEVTQGEITFNGKNLLELEPEERAREGIFLAFQYPVEIPGVSNMQFLKASVDAVRKHRELSELDAPTFMKMAREKCKELSLKPEFLKRGVNEGFSGGEKKRNEILQMALLEPSLCLLDETDSGLDIDALRIVACPSDPAKGDAYAGGFYLRAATACVLLRFTVARRSQTVWFGLGRRCVVHP